MKHCCAQMIRTIEEEKINLSYFSKRRAYGIFDKIDGNSFSILYFCPWCGQKLPENLWGKRCDLLDELIPDIENYWDDPRIPAEFKTDEWWKKRGL